MTDRGQSSAALQLTDIEDFGQSFINADLPVLIDGVPAPDTGAVERDILQYARSPEGPPPAVLDLRGTGVGKTERAIELTRALMADVTPSEDPLGYRVFWLVQSHTLARELEARIKAVMPSDVDVVVHNGLNQPVDRDQPDGEKFCRRADEVKHAMACGASISHVCGRKRADKDPAITCCPHHQLVSDTPCARLLELERLRSLRRGKVVVILAGAYFATHVPHPSLRSKAEDAPEALAAIFDEWRPAQNHVRPPSKITLEDLKVVANILSLKSGDWRDMIDKSAFAAKTLNSDQPLDVITYNKDVGGPLKQVIQRFEKEIEAARQTAGNEIKVNASWFREARGQSTYRSVSKMLSRLMMALGELALQEGAAVQVGKWDAIFDKARGRENKTPVHEDVVHMSRHNARLLRVRRFCDSLQDAIDDTRTEELATVRIDLKEFPRIVFDAREKLSTWLDRVPRLILDATAEKAVIERWLGPVTTVEDNGKRRTPDMVHVRQISDDQLSYAKIIKGVTYKWPELLRAHLDAASIRHRGEAKGKFDVGVVMPKDLLARMIKVGGPLPRNVGVLTYGMEAGINSLEGVVRGIVISRKLMNSVDIAELARAVFGAPIPQLGGNGGPKFLDFEVSNTEYLRQLEDCLISVEGGGKYNTHKWDLGEIIRRQDCDATFDQALGRFRAHRRDEKTPLTLDILTSHPAHELPIHTLLPVADLERQAGNDAIKLVTAGVLKGPQDRGWTTVAAVLAGRGRERFQNAIEDGVEYDDARHLAADTALFAFKRSLERGDPSVSEDPVIWKRAVSVPSPIRTTIPYIDNPYGNVVRIGEVWVEQPSVVSDQDRRPVVPITIQITADSDPVQIFARLETAHRDPCSELRDRLNAHAGFELHEITFLTGTRPARNARGEPRLDRKTKEPILIDSPHHVEPRARDRAAKSWPPRGVSTIAVGGGGVPWVHLPDPRGDDDGP